MSTFHTGSHNREAEKQFLYKHFNLVIVLVGFNFVQSLTWLRHSTCAQVNFIETFAKGKRKSSF